MLSEEDKRRIEEEEAYRASTRAKLEEKPKVKKGSGCGNIIGLGLLVILVFTFVASIQGGGSASNTESSTPALPLVAPTTRSVITLPSGRTLDIYEAQVLCEGSVQDRLVSPGSAKFMGRKSSEWTDPIRVGNAWKHTVVVDSQNSFGGLLRSRWLCWLDADADTIEVTEQ